MFTNPRPARHSRVTAPAARTVVVCVLLAVTGARLPGSGLSNQASGAVPVAPGVVIDSRGSEAFDFAEPTPLLESDWTAKTRGALSLAMLEYVVVNASPSPMSLTATLLWDAGTTEGQTAIVDHFVIPAGQQLTRRVDRARIPTLVKGERYPGLIQLSLESSEGETVVLPAFFVMPRRTDAFPPAAGWPFELMDTDRLETETGEISSSDQEDGAAVRVIEWRPSTTPAPHENGRGGSR